MATNADRKMPRFRVELSGRFRRMGTFQWTEVVVVNLSRTGLCFQTKSQLEIGEVVELEVDTRDSLGKPHQRRVLGTVQWQRAFRYGMRFV